MSPAQIAKLREPILAQLEERRQCTDKLNDQIHQLQKQVENDSNEKKQLQSSILMKDDEIASLKAMEVVMQDRMQKLVKEYITSPPTSTTPASTPTPPAEGTTGAAVPATVAPATTSTSDVLPP